MRPRIVIAFYLFIALIFSGCKKEAGLGGKNMISGTVFFKNGNTGNNDPAPTATVGITYGGMESSSSFDQTIVAGSDGAYRFEGLRKGEYFIKAGYTDEHGFHYTTPGYGIVFENKKKSLEHNIVLE
jgi:hypothetical protein